MAPMSVPPCPPDAAALLAVVDRFEGQRVVVLGDLVADEYVHGIPARISREAPVLILRFQRREIRLGGAANASHNLHTLGARVVPLGVVGDDWAGDALQALFAERGIPTEGLVRVPGYVTPVKTRVMAGGYGHVATRQQLVRVDREPDAPPGPAAEAALRERFRAWSREAAAVVLSDYGYGTVSDGLLELAREAARRGAVVTADSRYSLWRFRGVTAATPSEPEVEQLLGTRLDGDKAVEQAGWRLLRGLDARLLLVTRGARGLALFEAGGPATFLPVYGSDEIADVTGAGDTVIGAFTLALAGGARPVDAARLANYAGGLVVMKRGTATVSRAELCGAIRADAGTGNGDAREGARA